MLPLQTENEIHMDVKNLVVQIILSSNTTVGYKNMFYHLRHIFTKQSELMNKNVRHMIKVHVEAAALVERDPKGACDIYIYKFLERMYQFLGNHPDHTYEFMNGSGGDEDRVRALIIKTFHLLPNHS
jgi:hypothetical protein